MAERTESWFSPSEWSRMEFGWLAIRLEWQERRAEKYASMVVYVVVRDMWLGTPLFSRCWRRNVKGRFVRDRNPWLSMVREPIWRKGKRASESMMRDKSLKKFARRALAWG